jgi:hypothetical protein
VLPFRADREGFSFDGYDVVTQRFSSQHYYIVDGRLEAFPVEFRYVWPSELDLMARIAGMRLRDRWAGGGARRSRASAALTYPSTRSADATTAGQATVRLTRAIRGPYGRFMKTTAGRRDGPDRHPRGRVRGGRFAYRASRTRLKDSCARRLETRSTLLDAGESTGLGLSAGIFDRRARSI